MIETTKGMNGKASRRRISAALVLVASLASPAAGQAQETHSVGSLRFIGEQRIPNDAIFEGTLVGGLSGVDYDPRNGLWYAISDDKSEKAPARFYTLRLTFGLDGVDPVAIAGVTTLRQPDGRPFGNLLTAATLGGEVPDPEALRVDPDGHSLWWSSEGAVKLGQSPTLRQAAMDGTAKPPLPTPDMFAAHADGKSGARDNLSYEGLSFAPDGRSIWVSMEAPPIQDGPVPTPDAGTLTRITRFDRDGRILGQFAYPVDPIPARPTGHFADNGISDILVDGEDSILVLERSGVEAADKSFANYIRLYEADTTGATDIAGLPSLAGADVRPMSKRLVLDLNTLGLDRLDNVEGVSFGPKLPNGHDSLVLISDNNFNKSEVTQLLVFEVIPKAE
ncbi:Uncharacterized conserved protein [Faunimonas pinastri]|uniref:Uncharacterized conserved protein n=1 Tax=Faunimonas pinastri TaxID=1855383 RepID=A0A1H9ARW6_9HYPH|nr:esterase-like activity of phytase family protein [Faunimonas pinastri]SEP79271.1 Uncharacterized conserved protein [Faunimonas pinastri]